MHSQKTNKKLSCPFDEARRMVVQSLTEISLLPLRSCLIYYLCSPLFLPSLPSPPLPSRLIFTILSHGLNIFVWTPSGQRLTALPCHESGGAWQKAGKVARTIQLVILYTCFLFSGWRTFPGDLQRGDTRAWIWDSVCKTWKPSRSFNMVWRQFVVPGISIKCVSTWDNMEHSQCSWLHWYSILPYCR